MRQSRTVVAPLSTQVQKCAIANILLGVTLRWTSKVEILYFYENLAGLRPVNTSNAIFVALRVATFKIARVNHLRFCRRDIAEVSNMFEAWCNSERDKNRLCERAFRPSKKNIVQVFFRVIRRGMLTRKTAKKVPRDVKSELFVYALKQIAYFHPFSSMLHLWKPHCKASNKLDYPYSLG